MSTVDVGIIFVNEETLRRADDHIQSNFADRAPIDLSSKRAFHPFIQGGQRFYDMALQGDPSGCVKHPADIKTKVMF